MSEVEYSGRFKGAIEVVAEMPDIFVVGEVLSDVFEVRRILGRGAMGQVVEAFDLNLLRTVAIKAHHPETRLTSLRVEARALAAIKHPSIVTVHAFGAHRNIEYLVIELVEGITLESHLQRRVDMGEGGFSSREALDILVPVAEALAAVHRAGVTHRDVKPENVMLAAGDRVVLMDFGLGQREGELTIGGHLVGTPAYMAPELFSEGVQEGELPLVDVYAFGCMAYELLAGQLPYPADNAADACLAHIGAPVPVLPTSKGLSERLARLVASMMAKEPAHRPRMHLVAQAMRTIRGTLSRSNVEPFNVVVVDDDRDIAKLLSLYVGQGAPMANVRVVHSAKEAIAEVRRSPPQLLVFDLMMPEMNGIELFMYLRGTHLAEDTTFIAVSAAATEADIGVLQMLGVAHFIKKDGNLRSQFTAVVHEIARSARGSTPAMPAVTP
ncbi:MAG: protein kinase [Myxococcales bacterium]|jgi:serine/threonine-protein kinase|nr:protein kinase [Myxococcales bacterium]